MDFCFGLLEPRLMVQLVFRVFTIPFLGWFVSIYQSVSTESGKKDKKKKMGCICHLFFCQFRPVACDRFCGLQIARFSIEFLGQNPVGCDRISEQERRLSNLFFDWNLFRVNCTDL